jgi:hypothetical protein
MLCEPMVLLAITLEFELQSPFVQKVLAPPERVCRDHEP